MREHVEHKKAKLIEMAQKYGQLALFGRFLDRSQEGNSHWVIHNDSGLRVALFAQQLLNAAKEYVMEQASGDE